MLLMPDDGVHDNDDDSDENCYYRYNGDADDDHCIYHHDADDDDQQ